MEVNENDKDSQSEEETSVNSECSEYLSDGEECVDILNVSPNNRMKENSSNGISSASSANKFSIDRILGISDVKQRQLDNDEQYDNYKSDSDRESRFVKPTPLQASHRTG